jgi:hypothetical protein
MTSKMKLKRTWVFRSFGLNPKGQNNQSRQKMQLIIKGFNRNLQ